MNNLNSIDDIKYFIKENKFVILYFSSEGCSVCDDVLPMIEELLKKYPKVVSGHVGIQNIPSVASVLAYLLFLQLLYF